MTIEDTIRDGIRGIHKLCISNRIKPEDAAKSIADAMQGISRVEYDPNKKLRVYNHDGTSYCIPVKGLSRRERKNEGTLVIHLMQYSAERCNVRLEPKNRTPISTKHHSSALRNYTNQVLQYAA